MAKKVVKKKKAAAKPAIKKVAKKAPAKTPKRVVRLAKPVQKVAQKAVKTLDLSKFVSPLDDRILVKMVVGERITPGGLIIPDTSEITGNQQGFVVAVGRGHRDAKGRIRPLDLKVGDQILLPQYAGDSIQIAGQDVKILRESEILGILT